MEDKLRLANGAVWGGVGAVGWWGGGRLAGGVGVVGEKSWGWSGWIGKKGGEGWVGGRSKIVGVKNGGVGLARTVCLK